MSESNLDDRASIYDLFTRNCWRALENSEVEAVVERSFRARSPTSAAATKSAPSPAASRRNALWGRNFVTWLAISP